jgi:hypothetical protein
LLSVEQLQQGRGAHTNKHQHTHETSFNFVVHISSLAVQSFIDRRAVEDPIFLAQGYVALINRQLLEYDPAHLCSKIEMGVRSYEFHFTKEGFTNHTTQNNSCCLLLFAPTHYHCLIGTGASGQNCDFVDEPIFGK